LIVLSLIALAVWAAAFRIPGVREMVAGFVGALAVGVGVIAAAATLGLVGFGLFATYDRVAAWVVRRARWPEE
jgi:hypothetical protein